MFKANRACVNHILFGTLALALTCRLSLTLGLALTCRLRLALGLALGLALSTRRP